MYDVTLETSFFPAVKTAHYRKITIGDVLRERAGVEPDKLAYKVVDEGGAVTGTWTYGELLADCERLARALASRHKKGARIAVWAPNIIEWVLLEFASAMAGVTLVTVNPSYQPRELDYVLRQSEAEAVYFVESFRGNPMGDIARSVAAEIDTVHHVIDVRDHDVLFAGHERGTLPEVDPMDVAQIQYTSGTTGFPKGALLHHHGIVQNAEDGNRRTGVTGEDILLLLMPLFHTAGCGMMVVGGVSAGVTVVMPPMFDPGLTVDLIAREGVTYFMGVPSMITLGIETVKARDITLDSIRGVASGGSMVAPELVRAAEKYLGCPIQIVYGQTESSPVITYTWRDDHIDDMTQTAGQPIDNVDVAILRSDGSFADIGEIGEICTRGYHVMHGYNDNPEATAAAIDAEGWLHTGDLGSMDARGYVRITGRLKEMIIRGGENLFPAEIENAMLEHPAIAECAVVGIPDRKWGEVVACFMRPTIRYRPSESALKKFVRARLSPQKTPVHWIWVHEWPLTGSGKIQKFKLREMFQAGELPEGGPKPDHLF